jgi:hypothetical protein
MEDLQGALACYTRSLEMRPDYAEAAHWKTRVEARLQGEAFKSAEAAAGTAAAATTKAAAPPGQ